MSADKMVKAADSSRVVQRIKFSRSGCLILFFYARHFGPDPAAGPATRLLAIGRAFKGFVIADRGGPPAAWSSCRMFQHSSFTAVPAALATVH
jgi:hypothetical protein